VVWRGSCRRSPGGNCASVSSGAGQAPPASSPEEQQLADFVSVLADTEDTWKKLLPESGAPEFKTYFSVLLG
jgi:predicted metalloprotease